MSLIFIDFSFKNPAQVCKGSGVVLRCLGPEQSQAPPAVLACSLYLVNGRPGPAPAGRLALKILPRAFGSRAGITSH